MFDFSRKVLLLNGQESSIKSFEVQFISPWGIFETLDLAVEKCLGLDTDPTLLIQPVVVIVDELGRNEVFFRGR